VYGVFAATYEAFIDLANQTVKPKSVRLALLSGDEFAFGLQAVDLIVYFGNHRTNLLELDFLLGTTLGPFAEVWSCTKASLSSLN